MSTDGFKAFLRVEECLFTEPSFCKIYIKDNGVLFGVIENVCDQNCEEMEAAGIGIWKRNESCTVRVVFSMFTFRFPENGCTGSYLDISPLFAEKTTVELEKNDSS